MEQDELFTELQRLFETTRKLDEFEFVNVLIGFNGMGDQRALTHLYESRSYIADMKTQLLAVENNHSKVRLGLHIYCHLFEMDELYNILGNFLRIAIGQNLRYLPDLYNKRDDFLTPTDKFFLLKQLAEQCRFIGFVQGLEDIYLNEIRNAFLHSAYSLIDDDFCIVRGNGIPIGNQEHHSVSIKNFLLPLIDKAIGFIDMLFDQIDESKMSYSKNKIVQARMPDAQPVIILGNSDTGLIGFQTFVGSWIKIRQGYGSDYFVESMNLTFNNLEENQDLNNRLEKYIEKLTPYGKDFDLVKDEVIASGNPSLLRNLAIAYYNWANNTAATAAGKPEQQQDAIYKSVLARYELALQADPNFGRVYHNKGTAILKQAQGKNDLTNELRHQILALFDKAISLDENMYEAWLNSARLLSEIGNEEEDQEKQLKLLDESIRRYRKAVELYPRDSDPYKNLGWIYRRLAHLPSGKPDDFLESIANYEKAEKFNPDQESSLALATVLAEYAEQKASEAEEFLKRAIDILLITQAAYGFSSDISYRLGNKYLVLGKVQNNPETLQASIASFEKAVQLDAANIKAMNNWSNCEMTLSLFQENGASALKLLNTAKSRLEHIISLEPIHSSAWYNLGLIDIEFAKRNNGDEIKTFLASAVVNFQKAESLQQGMSIYEISRAYALMGDHIQAIKWLKEWLDNGNSWDSAIFPEDFDKIKNQSEFKQLIKQMN